MSWTPATAASSSSVTESNMEDGFYRSDLVSLTYDALTDAAGQIEGDLEFYRDCANRFGAPILELGVGTGRVAWMLAEAGYKVLGLDLSESMLQRAKERGSTLSVTTQKNVQLRQGDMADFSIDQRFPLALVPFSTFNHLTTAAAQRSCLNAVKHHLVPGGRLVIDMFDPVYEACGSNHVSPNAPRMTVCPRSGDEIHRRSIHRVNDPFNQTFKETFRVERIDKHGNVLAFEEPVHHLRWSTRQEMRYLFELTGFEIETTYGDFKLGEPASGNRQIWVLRSRLSN